MSRGIKTKVAENGTAGFLGDGAQATAAELNQPYGVTFDAPGNMYIADYSNSCIRKVTMSTGIISTFAGQGGLAGNTGDGGQATSAELNYPEGVAFDANGVMYIADPVNITSLRTVNMTTGIINTFIGSGLNQPAGIAFDASKCNLYITNIAGHNIQRTTVVTTVVNSPTVCAGTTATLTASGATTYSWSPS